MLLLGAFALLLSAIVTFFIHKEITSRLNLQPETPDQIVVAKVALPVGALIKAEDLTTVPWPKSIPLEGGFNDIEGPVGRGVVQHMQINEPVLEYKLGAEGSGGGLAPAIPEGMRAVAVRVNNVSGVAGFVLPGSRVDVILSGSPDGGRIDFSRVILENVQVLSAGQDVEYDAQGKPKNVPVVTLLLTPEQSQKLTLATIDGRIQLTLRNPLDLEEANPKAVRRSALYSGRPVEAPPDTRPKPPRSSRPRPVVKKVVAPVPPPVKTFEVELIQGDDRQKMKFRSKTPAKKVETPPKETISQ